MTQVWLIIPEEALVTLKLPPELAGAELRLAAVSRLSDYGVATFKSTPEELSADLSNA